MIPVGLSNMCPTEQSGGSNRVSVVFCALRNTTQIATMLPDQGFFCWLDLPVHYLICLDHTRLGIPPMSWKKWPGDREVWVSLFRMLPGQPDPG